VSQISIFGQHHVLAPMRAQWSEIVHAAAVDVLGLRPTRRFHRFFPMDPEDFPTPPGRSERYTIVELRLFTGRTVATKKVFYARIYAQRGGVGGGGHSQPVAGGGGVALKLDRI